MGYNNEVRKKQGTKKRRKHRRIKLTESGLQIVILLILVICLVVAYAVNKNKNGMVSGTQVLFTILLTAYLLFAGYRNLRKRFSMSKAGTVIILSSGLCVCCFVVTIVSQSAVITVLAVIFLLIGILTLCSAGAYEIVRRNTEKELEKDKKLEQRQTQRYIDSVAPEVQEEDDFSKVDEFGNPLDENGNSIHEDL